MASSTTEQSTAQEIIQLLGNSIQDKRPIEVIHQQANIKYYQSQGQTLAERTEGLNQAARLRTSIFHSNKENPDNRELNGFIEYLRLHDERVLSMIFYLAGIKSHQHQFTFDEFNKADKQSIIIAINQLKALSALIPKHIAMPV